MLVEVPDVLADTVADGTVAGEIAVGNTAAADPAKAQAERRH